MVWAWDKTFLKTKRIKLEVLCNNQGPKLAGRPVVRNDQNLRLPTKLQKMVAYRTTIFLAANFLEY